MGDLSQKFLKEIRSQYSHKPVRLETESKEYLKDFQGPHKIIPVDADMMSNRSNDDGTPQIVPMARAPYKAGSSTAGNAVIDV